MNPIVSVVAQMINFLIFAYILHRLLVKPVRAMMAKRKAAMEADLRQAETLKKEAEMLKAEAEKHEQDLEAQRDGILKEAREKADAHRREVLKQAEDQGRAKLERFRRLLNQERGELIETVNDDLRDTILEVAHAIVGDDAGALTDRAIERVEALLGELSSDDLAGAREALKEDGAAVKVRTAQALSDEQFERLKGVVAAKVEDDGLEIAVEEAPDLLAGIEVIVGHLSLAAHWRGVIDAALEQAAERDRKAQPQDDAQPEGVAAEAEPQVEQKES